MSCQKPDPNGNLDDCTFAAKHRGKHSWWRRPAGVVYRPRGPGKNRLRETRTTEPSSRVFPNRPVPAETAAKYASAFTETDEGCWISTFAAMPSGYVPGSYRVDGKPYAVTAHRAAWTHHYGPIPDGMTVHHKCFHRACVNPLHLGLMSNAENARRQRGADWPEGQCQYGHPNSSRRLYGQKKPVWRCGECVDAYNARITARRKAEAEAA